MLGHTTGLPLAPLPRPGRQCAPSSQGFPDAFHFYGNVHNKHRQVGNAVPPPLASALGRQLRKVLLETNAEREAALAERLAALR